MARSKRRVTYVTVRAPHGQPVIMGTRREPGLTVLTWAVGILGAAVGVLLIVGLVIA